DCVEVRRRRDDYVDRRRLKWEPTGVGHLHACARRAVLDTRLEWRSSQHSSYSSEKMVEWSNDILLEHLVRSAVRDVERERCSSLLGDDHPREGAPENVASGLVWNLGDRGSESGELATVRCVEPVANERPRLFVSSSRV